MTSVKVLEFGLYVTVAFFGYWIGKRRCEKDNGIQVSGTSTSNRLGQIYRNA